MKNTHAPDLWPPFTGRSTVPVAVAAVGTRTGSGLALGAAVGARRGDL